MASFFLFEIIPPSRLDMEIQIQIHPILLVLIEVITTAIVVGFTAPSSILRLGAFLIVALSTWQCISTAMEYMVRSPWASLVGGYAVTFLFHFVDIALLGRWSFKAGGPTTVGLSSRSSSAARKRESSVYERGDDGSLWDKFIFGLAVTCSFRFIGTPDQVKYVPLFSNRHPSYVPSRARFLQKTALTIFLCYLGLDLTTSNADPELNLKYFTLRHIPVLRRLHQISADEILMRVLVTIAAGISLTSVQRGTYSVVAFLSVLLGFGEPQDWPPFYGSLLDAYSLRRIWRYVHTVLYCTVHIAMAWTFSNANLTTVVFGTRPTPTSSLPSPTFSYMTSSAFLAEISSPDTPES